MIDGHRLPREVEGDAALRTRPLLRLERPHLFLRHADDDHAVGQRSASAIGRDHIVFARAALKGDERHRLRGRVGFDRAHEPIEHGREQRRRRDGMAQVIAEEVAQPARGLQLRQVGVEIEAVQATNGQGHMVANKLVHVGHRRLLLAKKSPDATPPEYAAGRSVGANALFPVKLRLIPMLAIFTRRFEAQLHWCSAFEILGHGFRRAAPGSQGAKSEFIGHK